MTKKKNTSLKCEFKPKFGQRFARFFKFTVNVQFVDIFVQNDVFVVQNENIGITLTVQRLRINRKLMQRCLAENIKQSTWKAFTTFFLNKIKCHQF